ncbi:hypothetical protein FRC03_002823 [Tulasnella sp. 419]|nr:hypothetical protein FRC03_002823 [Tulasnella sp. 419]
MPTKVTFDGELMHQIIPAMPISGNHSFHVVHGSESGHLLFSVGDSGQLFLFKPDGTNGQYSLLDIGARLGLPKSSTLSTLAVTQDTNKTIHVAFVVSGDSDNHPSRIFVVRPTQPSQWENLEASSDISSWVLQGELDQMLRTDRLYLGPVSGSNLEYPLLVAGYMKLDKRTVDVARLQVDLVNNKWSFDHTFKLPENPQFLVDACCGYLPSGDHGMFCLYRIQDQTSLTFASMTSDAGNVGLKIRPEVTTLATFINPQGYTDLLMGGNHLYHYTALACCESDSPKDPERFSIVSSDDTLTSGLQQLFIAQGGQELSVFSRNNSDSVVYQQFTVVDQDNLSIQTPPIPLLTASQGGGRFSVILDDVTKSQMLYILGSQGQLTLMEQSGGTRLWQTSPVLVPSSGENRHITTFTTHAHLADANGALSRQTVLLCSSAAVDLSVNAQSKRVTQEGVPVTTDSGGNLTIIHQVSDMSTVRFTIRDAEGSSLVLGSSFTYDPTSKIQAKLGGLTTASSLRNATLPNGEKLLSETVSSTETVEQVAQQLAGLHSHLVTLSQQPENLSSSAIGTVSKTSTMLLSGSQSPHDVTLWDMWHWVVNAVIDVKNWFIEAGEFIIQTAKQVYRFALSSVSHVMKAVSWVFEKLEVAVEKMVQFFGFLFEWNDILETHNILVNVVNCSFNMAAGTVDNAAQYVDTWFQKIHDAILPSLDIPKDAQNQTMNVSAGSQAENGPHSAFNSPAGNWSNYQLEHGVVGKSILAEGSGGKGGDSNNPLVQFWHDILLPSLKKIRDLTSHLKDNIIALFHPTAEVSIGDLLKHLGKELLVDLLEIIRALAVGLIKFVADLIRDAKGAINASINIPLLSTLYREISGGNDLTMLDAVSLLVAVPTTVVYKLVTGKKPGESMTSLLLKQASPKNQPSPHVAGASTESQLSSLVVMQEKGLTAATSFSERKDDGFAAKTLVSSAITGSFDFKAIIRFISEFSQVLTPVLNGIFCVLAPFDWWKVDLDTFEPEQFDPADPALNPATTFYTPAAKWRVVLGILSILGSFPLDCIADILPFSVSPRPAPTARFMIWALSCINIPAAILLRRKRALALVSTGVAVLQIPFACYSIYKDISAPDEEYPDRNGAIVAWSSLEKVLSLAGKISSSIASHTNGLEPVSFGIAMGTNLGTVATQFIIVGVNGHNGKYHELQSLFGI